MNRLLIVDDEVAICESLGFALENEFHVQTATTEEEAMQIVQRDSWDIVLLDLRLGKSDGLTVLEKIKGIQPDAIIIIMTAFGTIQSSVEAIKRGAYYYITKPINMSELQALLSNAAEYLRLKTKVQYLHDKLAEKYRLSGLIGQSAAMLGVFSLIEKVCNINTNVLISGESGTGKELAAKAIHYSGNRRDEPFEAINCAAIPAGLLESELFGYERGAFTGAVKAKKGIFELAHRGTLFLDEISEMDVNLQSKLLRVVQEREIMPIGGVHRKKLDVRIISATNRDIKKLVAEGNFREDLLFRLNVINLHMPPLRERLEDIPLLLKHFLNCFNQKLGMKLEQVDQAAMAALCSYQYKGNVRELENIIERAVALSSGSCLTIQDIEAVLHISKPACGVSNVNMIPVYLGEDLATVEKKVILHNLQHAKGNRRETAKILKISERNLRYKLREYQE